VESIALPGQGLNVREAYTSYSGTLYRFALGYSGSEARAAEAVQEVFLDLLRNPAPSVTIKDER
jgi:DNA-directed RNA polymerase specialized sigma24 family protein